MKKSYIFNFRNDQTYRYFMWLSNGGVLRDLCGTHRTLDELVSEAYDLENNDHYNDFIRGAYEPEMAVEYAPIAVELALGDSLRHSVEYMAAQALNMDIGFSDEPSVGALLQAIFRESIDAIDFQTLARAVLILVGKYRLPATVFWPGRASAPGRRLARKNKRRKDRP